MASKLSGKKASELQSFGRLKLLNSGGAGTGKSSLVAGFPRAYIVETEDGLSHYGELLEASGSRIVQTKDPDVVIEQVRALLTEEHDFLTFVIDPCTNLYQEEMDLAEAKVGDKYGRHRDEANKKTWRLVQLLLKLDMNIVFTAHEKKEFDKDVMTFDGWKKSDYFFDLWLRSTVRKTGDKVYFEAQVMKSRLNAFPMLAVLPMGESESNGSKVIHSYQTIAERFGREKLEAPARPVELATAEEVAEALDLMQKCSPSAEFLAKVYKATGSEDLRDFSREHIQLFIQRLKAQKV